MACFSVRSFPSGTRGAGKHVSGLSAGRYRYCQYHPTCSSSCLRTGCGAHLTRLVAWPASDSGSCRLSADHIPRVDSKERSDNVDRLTAVRRGGGSSLIALSRSRERVAAESCCRHWRMRVISLKRHPGRRVPPAADGVEDSHEELVVLRQRLDARYSADDAVRVVVVVRYDEGMSEACAGLDGSP